MTYTIQSSDLGRHWIVEEAGRKTAHMLDGRSFVIGEPLLDCCDAPAADGPCGCQTIISSDRRAA